MKSNQLTGDKLKRSQSIDAFLNKAVEEVVELSQEIETIREADHENTETLKWMMERISSTRGRPLFYPHIGSGIGHGCYTEVMDGSVKLDLINGIGVHILGHSHPRVIKAALKGALNDVVAQGHLQFNREYVEFSETVLKIASKNSRLKYAWISTCGAIANENAIKVARQKHSPAKLILAFNNAFAGRTALTLEITDNPAYKDGLPKYNEVLRVPYYDPKDPAGSSELALKTVKDLVAKHEGDIAVFSFEPMLGEGGFIYAPKEFLVPIFEFLRSKNIPIWADEIQTFTRTGEFFAFETLGIAEYIDICTIAKTVQLAVTFFTEDYNPRPNLIAGTFAASSSSLAAGNEILKVLQEGNFFGKNGRIQEIHQQFVSKLNHLNETTCKGLLTDAGGLGLMIAVTPFSGDKDKVSKLLQVLFKNGLIGFSCGKDPVRLRFLIPAIIEDKDIDLAMKILEKSILEINN